MCRKQNLKGLKYKIYQISYRNYKNNVKTKSLPSENGKLMRSTTDDKSTEKEFDGEVSMPIQTSETDRETTGAFQIDDDIPFIDEDSVTSLCKSDSIKLLRVCSTVRFLYRFIVKSF